MEKREAGTPRSKRDYRGFRRKNSNLGWSPSKRRSDRDWHGVEVKDLPEQQYPIFTWSTSDRGEKHSVRLDGRAL